MGRNRYFLLADLPLIVVAAFGAFSLRFDWLFLSYRPEFVPYVCLALIVKPLVFYAFGMYGRYWRYGTAQDVVAILLANGAASMLTAVAVGVTRAADWMPDFSRQVLFIDGLLTLAVTAGLRLSVRIMGDAYDRTQKPAATSAKNVLVVGAGDAGTLVVRELRRNPQLGMNVVGFLDDAPEKARKQIHGVQVLGPLSLLPAAVRDQSVDQVIIAMPTAGGQVVREAAAQCREAGVHSRIVPGVFELLDGKVSVSRLREIEIADLLRRRQVQGAESGGLSYVQGRSVLITGAGGSIGSELCRQVAFARPRRLVILGHGENSIFSVQARLLAQYPEVPVHAVIADVRDAERMNTIFGRCEPEVVFHAAAHKHVPLMEVNPEEAITNNVQGTRNSVQAALKWGVQRFVLISTDKAVAPSSMMGVSKRVAESLVMEAGRASKLPYVAVRFGNVLGSRGSVVPTLRAQIERGGPVTVTHPNMKRYFMTIPEAVHLVLSAGGLGREGELFVLNMGEQLLVLDLARDLIRLSGLDPDDVPITFTGMRPGEKLEEALWEPDAQVEVTDNPDVFRVQEPSRPCHESLASLVEGLLEAAHRGDRHAIYALLTTAVPSYHPPSDSGALTL